MSGEWDYNASLSMNGNVGMFRAQQVIEALYKR
jgi:hypothetical protein